MEDVTSQPMRRIAKRIGRPGLMFTEFVSAMALHYNPTRTHGKLRIHPEEHPVAIQIFGAEPDKMAESAKIAVEFGADVVDINMGCWVPKVCRTGSGAALLKDAVVATRIVEAVVNAVEKPVTVKVRAGWDRDSFAAPELAKRFQDAGAQMITLHARFAKQGFEGEADWRLIEQLRKAISIPLIGNGDVKTAAQAIHMMETTGCDGVMVGRVAISNPWALGAIRAGMMGEAPLAEPTLDERIDTALEHLRLAIAHEEAEAITAEDAMTAELRACRSLRGQIPIYIKGEPGAAALRDKLTRCSSYEEFAELLEEFRVTDQRRAVGSL